MPKRDSIDKIVQSYFHAVAAEPFTYKGERYSVRDLHVSPLLVRGYTCPPHCGGCCSVFTLDYLPTESHPYELTERRVEFNERRVRIMSDLQAQRTEHHCTNLKTDGRCGIHGQHPFSCDFELIRFMHTRDRAHVATRLYGHGHIFLRVDGERGARCTITEPTKESVADVRRKLARLAQWCEWFGLRHRIELIDQWIEAGARQTLVLPAQRKGFFAGGIT